MADYWQMTLAELDRDAVQPIRHILHFGTYTFDCPICGECVGIWRDPRIDSMTNGMTYKQDVCKHGHAVDWSSIKEAE